MAVATAPFQTERMSTSSLDPSYGENSQGQYDYNGLSTDPSLATNWYPTEQAAQSAWFSQNPQYGANPSGVYGSPNSSAAPVSNPTASSSTPGAASTTGGNTTTSGLPTASAVASNAPLPIQSFGPLASVTPTYGTAATTNAATVDPAQSQYYMQQAYSQNAAALAPQFQQQQMNLQDSSAARGISNSGAASELQGNLLGQQSSALAAADSPITQQGYGYSQSDIAANQANQQATNFANQSAQNTFGLANQAAANNATGTNANYYNQALTGNATSYNDYLATLEGQGYNTGNEAYQTYLNSFLPQSGVGQTIANAGSNAQGAYNGAYSGAISNENAQLGAAGAAAGGFSGGGTPAVNGGQPTGVTPGYYGGGGAYSVP